MADSLMSSCQSKTQCTWHLLPVVKTRARVRHRCDVIGCDVIGRAVIGCDVIGRDVIGCDVIGRDVIGRGGSQGVITWHIACFLSTFYFILLNVTTHVLNYSILNVNVTLQVWRIEVSVSIHYSIGYMWWYYSIISFPVQVSCMGFENILHA